MTIDINAPATLLRQRMQQDMLMRGLGPHTQQDYLRHVRRFAAFLGRPPDSATVEDLRRFQLHQHESGASAPTINGAVSALRFLFTVTLGTVSNFVREAGYRHQMTNLSPKITANWVFASDHSRGGRFHSWAALLSTRYNSFIAASSPGK